MNNEKQQTAVDWFAEMTAKLGYVSADIFEQAKEMEKNRIIDDWRDGFLNGRKSMQKLDFSNAKQYYNETYGGN